jgi:hypothetical protein
MFKEPTSFLRNLLTANLASAKMSFKSEAGSINSEELRELRWTGADSFSVSETFRRMWPNLLEASSVHGLKYLNR